MTNDKQNDSEVEIRPRMQRVISQILFDDFDEIKEEEGSNIDGGKDKASKKKKKAKKDKKDKKEKKAKSKLSAVSE